MISRLDMTSLKSVCEMQLLHTPATKFPSQFASPKPNTKKAYMSGCDSCTSKEGEKGNTSLKKQNYTKQYKTTPLIEGSVDSTKKHQLNLLGK